MERKWKVNLVMRSGVVLNGFCDMQHGDSAESILEYLSGANLPKCEWFYRIISNEEENGCLAYQLSDVSAIEIIPMRDEQLLSPVGIDFDKQKFVEAFKRFSKEHSNGAPENDWFYIIENHGDLSKEENLARLVWKGIDAQTAEYSKEVDKGIDEFDWSDGKE